MAKNLDLRQYQEDILTRIKELAGSPDAEARSRLGVQVGEDRLLVRLGDISEVAPLPDIHPVPMTRPWFLGMANVRGNLYGINDVAQLGGQPATAQESSCRVLLAHQKYKTNAGLLVSAILGLRSLDQLKASEAPARKHPWLSARAWLDARGDTWQELDMPALLQAPDFLKIGIG